MRIKSALRQIFFIWGLAAIAALLVVLHGNSAGSNSLVIAVETPQSQSSELASLPSAKPHPLPATLAQWHDQTNSGDYFQEVNPTRLGYLIWSQFPIKIYIQQPHPDNDADILKSWANEVLQAIQEWSIYLPLQVIEQPEVADIKIIRFSPPLRIAPNQVPRARSAETSYEFYISSNNVLSHRCSILLSPSQAGQYLQAAVRHEFGHALGIWGHSLLQSDALYFAQVRNPPPISARDVNTLKRIYEQPTQLGWTLSTIDD
ncbi:peptidase [Gloeocapsopsis dulcis]|uniref:Peptidase n=1 Tax=Gloeocapsopsis dulcis AAB1 = 1H9 TaxID=1433147 RepID=A0A6N8FWC9_9CHRO|nr:peptidase [Gloeocapsopsis dulcis]MUL37074.1 peptidase [Gloeocapsopsis dulcis AAB1 = 1H9]WNN88361.1 peptidase [Gloeocapsopsis dulcis]